MDCAVGRDMPQFLPAAKLPWGMADVEAGQGAP